MSDGAGAEARGGGHRPRGQRAVRPHGRCGFTLLELITVLAIMIIIMASAVVSIVGIRRGAEMRGGVSAVRATIAAARQAAVTRRERVTVHFELNNSQRSDSRAFWVTDSDGQIGETNYLSRGLVFAPSAPGYVGSSYLQFMPTGGSGSASNAFVIIGEVSGTQTNVLKLYGLTGLMRIEQSM